MDPLTALGLLILSAIGAGFFVAAVEVIIRTIRSNEEDNG